MQNFPNISISDLHEYDCGSCYQKEIQMLFQGCTYRLPGGASPPRAHHTLSHTILTRLPKIELDFCDDAKESLTLDKECMVAERIFWIHRISEAVSECLHWLDWGSKKGVYKR